MEASLVTKTLFVGLLVGVAHIISGIAVLVVPESLNVTPLAALQHFALYLGYDKGGFAAAVLLAAGGMAVLGANLRAVPHYMHAVMFLPQQALLFMQIWTITFALIVGRYPDGYIPQGGAWFILSDQIWAWVLAVSHSLWLAAYLYGGRNGDSNTS
jgi:hypothetical protein